MRITERQLRQIIREELNEMRKPEGDPSDPSTGHGRFPGMDDDLEPDPIPRMWFDQGRSADDDLDEDEDV